MAKEGQLVVFELDSQKYGLPVLDTQEIMRMVKVNPVPSASAHIEGVINLRGHVIPVVNLSRRLGLTGKGQDGDTRIIIVEQGGRKTGLIVDRVLEVGRYYESELVAPEVIGNAPECISGYIRKDGEIWLLLEPAAVGGGSQGE